MNVSYHPDFMLHDPGEGHPERKERLEAIIEVFDEKSVWDELDQKNPDLVDDQTLELIHSTNHIKKVEETSLRGGGSLDPDTRVSSLSMKAARRAVGAGMKLTQEAIDEKEDGFGLVRPPGHHAKRNKAMGFCLFNNVGICAEKSLENCERTAIVDWDTHHGNGHQEAFYERDDVLYLSIHQSPHYPNTGALEEIGEGRGRDYNINIPLRAGKSDEDYGYVFDNLFVPILERHDPEIIFVSAGEDTHQRDNYSGMELTNRAFESMAEKLTTLEKPIVGMLEGGYNTEVLPHSILAILDGLGVDVEYEFETQENDKRVSDETKDKVSRIKQITDRWF